MKLTVLLCLLSVTLPLACSSNDDGGGSEIDGGGGAPGQSATGGTGGGTDWADEREASCAVPPPTECLHPPPTYAKIRPVLDRSCNTCHNSSSPNGEWPLDDYAHVVAWSDSLRDEVLNCLMPPVEAEPLPPDDRLLLMQWIRCGLPP